MPMATFTVGPSIFFIEPGAHLGEHGISPAHRRSFMNSDSNM